MGASSQDRNNGIPFGAKWESFDLVCQDDESIAHVIHRRKRGLLAGLEGSNHQSAEMASILCALLGISIGEMFKVGGVAEVVPECCSVNDGYVLICVAGHAGDQIEEPDAAFEAWPDKKGEWDLRAPGAKLSLWT